MSTRFASAFTLSLSAVACGGSNTATLPAAAPPADSVVTRAPTTTSSESAAPFKLVFDEVFGTVSVDQNGVIESRAADTPDVAAIAAQ